MLDYKDILTKRYVLRLSLREIAEQTGAGKSYERWYVGGHSLGGLVAAKYAAKNAERINGVVLLASYPRETLPEPLSLLCCYGSNDGCLDRDRYEASRKNWPADSEELIIDGGNHAGFGNYGKQRGDRATDCTPGEQQRSAAEAIARFTDADETAISR